MLKWLLSLLVVFTIAACLAPEQTTPKGVWVVTADAQMASVSGRVTQQIWKKLNPVWWFLNDDEREMTRKQRFERASNLQHAFRPGAPNGRHHVGRLCSELRSRDGPVPFVVRSGTD